MSLIITFKLNAIVHKLHSNKLSCSNTPTDVIFNGTLQETEHRWFQCYNTYHLAANDKSLVNVSGWLADEPTDKITQAKPTCGTVQ